MLHRKPVKSSLLHRFTDIRVLAALVSVVLSAWAIFLDDVVNNDGILYLRTAEALSRGDWQAALGLYRWLFYAFLISAVSQITSLSFEYSAHVLNAALTALTVASFLTLIREVGGDRKTIIAAAFVVLLYPGLNEYRSFVIRDLGYVAFYLVSLLFFIKNLKSPDRKFTVGWVTAMVVASLFRIEGFVFLLLLPLIQKLSKTTTWPAKAGVFTALVVVSIFLSTTLGWWLFGSLASPDVATVAARSGALLQALWQNIMANVSGETAATALPLPDKYSGNLTHGTVIVTLTLILLTETLARLTPLYAALAGHAVYRNLAFPVAGIRAVWLWLIVLNLGILAAIVLVRLFLTGRFPIALSLTVMLAVPFSLVVLYEGWREKRGDTVRNKWIFPIVCVLFFVMAVDGLYGPTNKGYLKDAGTWITENTSTQSTAFSNNAILLYYSGKTGQRPHKGYSWEETLTFVRSEKWLAYDYLAFQVKREHSDQAALLADVLGRAPVIEFENRKHDKALIFKVR